MRLFIPFLIVLFVVALLMRVELFVTVVYFLVTIYVLTRLWVRHSVEHLQLGRTFLNRAFLGDAVEVTVHVVSSSRVPVPWIEVADSVPTELRAVAPPRRVLSLGGREHERFTYRLSCTQRGYYLLGPLYTTIGDLLGVEQRDLMWQNRDPLIVYPRVLSINRLGLQALAPQASLPVASPLIEDPSRVVGVRDYQPGDSPRRMHWSATARLSRLVVRQYEPTIARETMICLDLDENHYPDPRASTELGIVVAASLANHVVTREKLPIGLTVKAGDALADGEMREMVLPPGSGRGHLISLLELLARAQMRRDTGFLEALRRQSVRLTWGTSIVVITGTPNTETLETLLYLRRGGFAVSLIVVQTELRPPPVDTGGDIPMRVVRNERDVELVR